MKVEIDETKNKVLIRRIANDIRLKTFFERSVTYKEINERINKETIETMVAFLLLGSLLICYILAFSYASLSGGKQYVSKDEVNLIIGVFILALLALELGALTSYGLIKRFVIKDFREADDLEIINLNK